MHMNALILRDRQLCVNIVAKFTMMVVVYANMKEDIPGLSHINVKFVDLECSANGITRDIWMPTQEIENSYAVDVGKLFLLKERSKETSSWRGLKPDI